MSRLVTLAQLRADVRDQADIAGATARHVPSLINHAINQSIVRFRERLSSEGSTVYLASAYGTLTSGRASLFPFGLLDVSSAPTHLVKVYGIDVHLSTDDVRRLTMVPFEKHTEYGTATGEPTAWAAIDRTRIAILPAPMQAYAYTLWYLPTIAELANDSDTWDGVAGWEQYVTWDVVCRVIVRDQTGKAYAMAVSARNEVWQDILKSARSIPTPAGHSTTRDAMGERLYGLRTQRTLPRP